VMAVSVRVRAFTRMSSTSSRECVVVFISLRRVECTG
jgi:hypothetical protein